MKSSREIRVGMVGAGMIFEETYLPAFEALAKLALYSNQTGPVEVRLAGIASRTGNRANRLLCEKGEALGSFELFCEPGSVDKLLATDVDAICVATPDDRHFEACKAVLSAGKHLLVEKPSVLNLAQWRELVSLAQANNVVAKVVYHKLLDPDHKKLRTLVVDGTLQHVNNGYCSLLEPRWISKSQFSEWITGRNPSTYVAVHYIKLIDFTFGGRLTAVQASGQRGIVAAADGTTWDSVQLRLQYQYQDSRTATFDIHTSWVHPDNFPGYVEQEVQFRFDNGVWNGHSRKRGVELTVEGRTPTDLKTTLNNHYSTQFLEPWGEPSRRGYGIETVRRFFEEVAHAEYAGEPAQRNDRLTAIRELHYNDLSADGQVVAAVEATEKILEAEAAGRTGCLARIAPDLSAIDLLEPK